MNLLSVSLLTLLVLGAPVVEAREVAGVNVPERVEVQGEALALNGAGVRSRFFVKVYVGALYLKQHAADPATAIRQSPPKSVRLHFLYKEVAAEKLVEAWNDGFKANTGPDVLAALEPRIAQFNALFPAVRKGDAIRLDLLSDGATRVSVNDQALGAIPGADFQQALLRIWLGEKPADASLKQAMLGR
jgi:hypothetical protein